MTDAVEDWRIICGSLVLAPQLQGHVTAVEEGDSGNSGERALCVGALWEVVSCHLLCEWDCLRSTEGGIRAPQKGMSSRPHLLHSASVSSR